MYDGREVANYILDFCAARGRKITHLALQKIAFFCHAECLVSLNRPLIRHKFEAWKHGPVLQYLYHDFKEFDDAPITARAKRIDLKSGVQEVVPYQFDGEILSLLERAADFYSRLDAIYLRNLSHAEGGPWEKVWDSGGKINPGMKIHDEDIRCFYAKPENHALLQ